MDETELRRAEERAERVWAAEDERAVMHAGEYVAGERPFLIDPQSGVECFGGPLDGRVMGDRLCECEVCALGGSHSTWPVRWNPAYDGETGIEDGEYVLRLVWTPKGAPYLLLRTDDSGEAWVLMDEEGGP